MGCCFSCFNGGDNKSQNGEPNERTTLLGNPVSNSIGRPLFSQDFSEVVSGQLGDEQAALNKILHQTAIDIIDVSAIPTHIEQKDYIDRVRLYHRRLMAVQLRHGGKNDSLLRDLPFPEKILSENPLSQSDIKTIDEAFKEAFLALKGIEVQPHDDLVTKFGVS